MIPPAFRQIVVIIVCLGVAFAQTTEKAADNNLLTCKDARGFEAKQGDHYQPTEDACMSCLCEKGHPKHCMTVMCAAPRCRFYKPIPGKCCEVECTEPSEDSYKNNAITEEEFSLETIIPDQTLPVGVPFTSPTVGAQTVDSVPSDELPASDNLRLSPVSITSDEQSNAGTSTKTSPQNISSPTETPESENKEDRFKDNEIDYDPIFEEEDEDDINVINPRFFRPEQASAPANINTNLERSETVTVVADNNGFYEGRNNRRQGNNDVPNSLDSIIQHCCALGQTWFVERGERCFPYSQNIAGVSESQQGNCAAIVNICCLTERQDKNCIRGKQTAKVRNSCDGLESQLGNEDQRECCNCCMLGIEAHRAGLSCQLFNKFAIQCSAAFEECCESDVRGGSVSGIGGGGIGGGGIIEVANSTVLISPRPTNDPNGLCAKFPNQICGHICIDVPGSYRCECRDGFELHSDRRSCVQTNRRRGPTNRCLQNNPCEHNCIDTGSAVRCECDEGYVLQSDQRSCADLDECLLNTHNCQAPQKCENTEGSFACIGRRPDTPQTCPTGMAFDSISQKCEDIDECIINPNACAYNEDCINSIGSFECRRGFGGGGGNEYFCGNGYSYNRVTRECEDINECASSRDTCTQGQICENTIGSYTCTRSTGCGTGYTLDRESQQCIDDDECRLGTDNCGVARECRNTPGSFRCVEINCPNGYKLEYSTGRCVAVVCPRGLRADSSGTCIDINECRSSNPCRANQECKNTVGSYQCSNLVVCDPGYELNNAGTRCQDIDECQRGTHDCTGHNMVCINRPGSYICQCPEGYQMNHQRRVCEDINECDRFGGQVCSLNSECQNNEGSFRCVCKEGFTQSGGDNRICKDIDECDRRGMCQHGCRNTWGSFQCTCYEGYEIGEDARTCVDIDECALWEDRPNQLCIGDCQNTAGSYTCTCPSGYQMSLDGRTCQDLDECALKTANCDGENDICINTRGSFKCERVVCPKGFVKAPTRSSQNNVRCQRRSFVCPQGDTDCLYAPLSYSTNFLSFPGNVRVPADLFTMRGPVSHHRRLEFELDIKSATNPSTGDTANLATHFNIRKQRDNEAVINLLKQIKGPMDIELQLNMNIYSREFREDNSEVFFGTAVAIIKIYVTEDAWVSY